MTHAERWLAERGVVRAGDGWADAEAPDRPLTGNEVAHAWAGEVFTDDDLTAADRIRLAFELLDLLDDGWVMSEIRMADRGPDGPLPPGLLWAAVRRRLEEERDAEHVTHSLWTDWFEDRATSATAFAEVLGHDIDRLTREDDGRLLRRARRVLPSSGPVPWASKRAAYTTASRVPALHLPLFQALLACYHDVYGDLDPSAALTLLTSLDLPPDTPHLTALRTVLAEGHTNHHRSPQAWPAAEAR
ncbi:hypothetical protein [Streptomyces sp. NPDC096132]|uniref:hypothetical protein n=1 Tax=Streptomyces sp. NPDC096132 TaxID=3366075 RepID=UPI00381F0542